MQVFNPRSGLCDDQKNVEGCEETYPDEPRELDIEVGELITSVTIYLGQVVSFASRYTVFVTALGILFFGVVAYFN